MATPKPQIRSLFPTPVCLHFLPVAQEVNSELKPLVLAKAQEAGAGISWRSPEDFASFGGGHGDTLFRVLRDLADSMSVARTGARLATAWKTSAVACVRQKGATVESHAKPGAVWSGVYYVDDGYQKSDDATLGGECELADPRGVLPAMVAPDIAFRIPGGLTAGMSELIRPQSGMIILHPSWLPRGERRYEGAAPRVTVEFDLAAP